jgi:DNA-binding MarR family transcriptional regulator
MEFSDRAAKDAGLQPLQHQALLAIRGMPVGEKVTIGELARRLCSKPQSTSELVSRMQQQGLLLRHTDLADGRKVWVEITDWGLEVLEKLSSAHRDVFRRLRPRFEKVLQSLEPGQETRPEESL